MKGPNALTDKQRADFFGAVMTGCKLSHAAALAGFDLRRVQYWVDRSKLPKANPDYVTFAAEYESARNKGIAYLTRDIRRIAKTDGRTAQWMLARMDAQWRDPDKTAAREAAARLEPLVLRRAAADAALAEARAEAAALVVKRGGAGMLLLAEDVLGAMPPDLQARLREYLAGEGVSVLERRDLAAGVTDDDVANASPTPPDDEAGT